MHGRQGQGLHSLLWPQVEPAGSAQWDQGPSLPPVFTTGPRVAREGCSEIPWLRPCLSVRFPWGSGTLS